MAPLIGASPGKTLHGRRVRPALGALLVALLTFVVPAHAQPSRETFERILEAAPGAPTARPKHPRLLLIFNRSEGYRHSAIPFGAAALEVIGKKTGAYETVQSEDPAMLRPENLNRFDAVCLNNTTQLKIEDPLARKGLLDFIAGGKGIIGIHAATDNFPTWSEGQEMLGGVFDGHPWTADGTWQVENEDPAHPLNAAFGGKGFLIKDEIYRIRQIELRKNSRVLLGLDMKAARNRTAIGVRSTDRDIPISWVRTYGKGRLFYCSLGHNESVYTNPAVLRHYLDGIQFALGDLEVETTPVGFNPMTFYDADRLTGLLRRVSAYQYGESRAALTEMNAFIRGVEDIPEARERMEGEFLSFLQGGGTLAGKQFICAKLALTGSAAAAGVLSAMLADSATSDMALSALESIGGPASEAALEAALTRTDGRTLAGVITALGNLRATRTIPRLEALSCHSEPGVSIAAISALGNMGTPASGAGLERLLDSTRGEVRAEIPGAMLACAERLRSGGDTAGALRLYTLLSHAGYPAAVRGAALRGRVLSRPGSGGELIRETLRGSDSTLHGTAARLLGEINDMGAARSVAQDLREMPPDCQAQILTSLARYRDPTVQAAASGASTSTTIGVRIAAIRTLGAMGDAGAVLPLARAAARSAGDGKKAARESLDGLSAPGVNDSLAALLGRVEAAVKLELLRTIGVRCVRATAPRAATVGPGEAERTLPAEFSGMPLVLGAAKDPDRAVRIESAKTLRAIAGAEQVKAMIGLLRSSRDESFRREMELSIASAALRGPPPPAAEILQAYASVNDVPSRIALINILGKTGGAESIPLLRRTLHDPEADIRLSSIRALSSWPTAQPYGDLRTVAGTARSSRERILALRGAVRLIGLDSSASTDETVRRYRDAMLLAPDAAERTLVISSLGETRSIAALRLAGDYLGDRDLHGAAESAALNIAQNIPDSAQRETVPILKKLISSSTDSGRSEKARTLLAAIEIHDGYITAWEYAGPFADSDDRQLDIPFTPELSPGAYVAWTALPAGTGKNSAWLPDLDGLIGGEDGVVYLRTNVWSPSEGNARLEAGSNYGIKIWWNGKIVHASTALRSLNPGSDRIPVVLKGGWNTILVKVEQGERPWGACLRVRAPDGSAQEGVRASTVQN